MSLANEISQLTGLVPNLSPRGQEFALSLINQYIKKGSLSEKQTPFVAKLIEQAKPKPAPVSLPAVLALADLGDLAALKALFTTSAAKLKRPKVRLDVKGVPVEVSLAGPKSKAPGSLNVTGKGFGSAWYGRITAEGNWQPSKFLGEDDFAEALVSTLIDLNIDPAGTVAKYGKLSGSCSFCGKQLTDHRSVAVGYGPICAEQWGLKDQWDAAAKTAAPAINAVVLTNQGAA